MAAALTTIRSLFSRAKYRRRHVGGISRDDRIHAGGRQQASATLRPACLPAGRQDRMDWRTFSSARHR